MAPRYDVREVQDRGRHWQVVYDVTQDDGSVTEHGHSIPKDTLEWRAAEYDLHPVNDLETILDMVLAEPYIAPEDRVAGEELHDAPDIATARIRHVSRCAKAKLKHRIITRKTANGNGKAKAVVANPLDVIRVGAVIDPEVVAVKKEHVRRARLEARAGRREDGADRLTRIAKELNVDLTNDERGKNRG